MLTTVQVPPRAGPPSTAVLLQPLVQQPSGVEDGEGAGRELTATDVLALWCLGVRWNTGHCLHSDLPLLPFPVSPVVLIQGAIRVQPEGPAPAAPRSERKSIVPAPMPGNSCPPEVDVSVQEGGEALEWEEEVLSWKQQCGRGSYHTGWRAETCRCAFTAGGGGGLKSNRASHLVVGARHRQFPGGKACQLFLTTAQLTSGSEQDRKEGKPKGLARMLVLQSPLSPI